MGAGTWLGSTWLDEVDARVRLRRAETSRSEAKLRLCVLPKNLGRTGHVAVRVARCAPILGREKNKKLKIKSEMTLQGARAARNSIIIDAGTEYMS